LLLAQDLDADLLSKDHRAVVAESAGVFRLIETLFVELTLFLEGLYLLALLASEDVLDLVIDANLA
jgi:hypothetical protein